MNIRRQIKSFKSLSYLVGTGVERLSLSNKSNKNKSQSTSGGFVWAKNTSFPRTRETDKNPCGDNIRESLTKPQQRGSL